MWSVFSCGGTARCIVLLQNSIILKKLKGEEPVKFTASSSDHIYHINMLSQVTGRITAYSISSDI